MVDIHRQVLDQQTLTRCVNEMNELTNSKWYCSAMVWPDLLRRGQTGLITHTPVSRELAAAIKKQVAPYMPEHKDLDMHHYLWHKYSGISMHDDPGHLFGATLYLNKNWDINYGGIFIWRDVDGSLHAVSPEYNTMVVNSKKRYHMVSMVSPLANEYRQTIQIWGR